MGGIHCWYSPITDIYIAFQGILDSQEQFLSRALEETGRQQNSFSDLFDILSSWESQYACLSSKINKNKKPSDITQWSCDFSKTDVIFYTLVFYVLNPSVCVSYSSNRNWDPKTSYTNSKQILMEIKVLIKLLEGCLPIMCLPLASVMVVKRRRNSHLDLNISTVEGAKLFL